MSKPDSMASTCSQPVAHSYPHASTVELGFQFSKPPSPSDSSIFGCAARFNLPAMDVPALTSGRRFQAPPAVGQPLPTACAAELSEDGEIFDSDDDDDDDDNDIPSVRQTLAPPKQVIEVVNLTRDDDGDSEGDDGNHTETASGLPASSLYPPPSSLPSPLAHTADDLTTSSTAAPPGKKKHPWKNVPPWSSLYHKLQRRFEKPLDNPSVDALHAKSPRQKTQQLAERSDISPEIPAVEIILNINGSNKAPPSIADSSERTPSLVAASASSLPDLGEGGPAVVDISKFTAVNILDKRLSSSGVEYRCEFEPLWLAPDLVEKAQTGAIQIKAYEKRLVQARRLETLRPRRKRKHSEM